MARILLFNKPFQVLSQFTDSQGRATLADFIDQPDIYAAGRLDYDSEGLLLLTDDGRVQQQIADPRFKLEKTYWVQVEGEPDKQVIEQLQRGVELKDGLTRPARCRLLEQPQLWLRVPPIRQRNNDVTSWLELKIREGRNRQVRRMTAAVGHPTLRLIRMAIGNWRLDGLEPGQWRMEQIHLPASKEHRTAKGGPKPGAVSVERKRANKRKGVKTSATQSSKKPGNPRARTNNRR